MKKIAVLLLLLLSTSVYSFTQRVQDSLALVALYNSTGGPNWTNRTNWLSSEPISTWYGVQLLDNRVRALSLIQNNLSGIIPPEIGNLTNLYWLLLQSNLLSGTIPIEIGNLTNLSVLALEQNNLVNNIPPEIGNLTKLTALQLNRNQLSGSIPSEIGNLTNLTNLDLTTNELTGTIPSVIWNMTNLSALFLGDNSLSGIISPDIGNLINLQHLVLVSNGFTGTIPSEIGNLTKLTNLSLGGNHLSGTIPTEIWNLTNLTVLWLSGNQISGTIPSQINNLLNLNALQLNNNKLIDFPQLTLNQLDFLNLHGNCFTFEDIEPNVNIPIRIEFTYFSQDSIGLIQNVIRNIGENYTLTVTCGGVNNQYQWYKNGLLVPTATSTTYSITSLNFSDAGSYTCAVTNTVATGLTINSRPINLSVVDNGRAQDSLALVALYNSTGGANWTNKTNWLSSQPISTWFGITMIDNRVGDILLHSNNLTGTIPIEFWNLTALQYLNFNSNQLSGNISPEIGNLTNLKVIELGWNKLSGSIPLEVWGIINLRRLCLSNNQLSGTIPTEIGNLVNLEVLLLGWNAFSGTILTKIVKLTKLIHEDFSNNLFSGIIPKEIGNMTKLQDLNLQSNQFTGTIPQEIGNMVSLKAINLSTNHFTGTIPSEIWHLTNLEMLLLCVNQFYGIISPEIGNLINLEGLYLQYNLFSGTIPKEIGSLINLKWELSLNDNQLIGTIPAEINNLIKLTRLGLNNNKFDEFPTITLGFLDYLTIENNSFTFEDIESNIGVPKQYIIYSPQDSIGKKQNVNQRINKSYTFTVTCGGAHNQYQWYKNNVVIPLATHTTFKIPKLKQSDAGSYTCNVTNTVATGLTINSRPINLTVTLNGRAKDSLALVTIYNTLHGETWTNNTNWLSSEPISAWYGVTVGSNTGGKGELYDTTSVVSLNLSGNNLNGQIPEAIGDMIALQTLKLVDNHISGSVPIEINNITSLQTLELSKNKLDELPTLTLTLLDTLLIDNNQFSFEDILPNLSIAAKGFTYYSQDSIGIKKDTICNLNSSIKFTTNDSSSNNIYQWYKYGVSIPNANGNTYLKSNLLHSDAGSYTCTITNTSVPGLTIYQRPVKLLVSTITDVDEINSPGFKVYPNPTGGIIYIETSRNFSSDTKIEVIDIYGKIVSLKDWMEGIKQELNLMHLSKGMYFLRVQNKNSRYFQKVVIR
jgi:Leucine-rich repeat (LRR) protein